MENLHIYNTDIEPDLQFFVYDLNEFVYHELKDVYEVYKCLTSDLKDSLLRKIRKEDVCFDYNTETREATLTVKYIDSNSHIHCIVVTVRPKRSLHLTIHYLFDGVFTDCKSYRSFAELLMSHLWQKGYDASLWDNDNGLLISVKYYNIFKSLIDIIRHIIGLELPNEWYYNLSPRCDYPNTYFLLSQVLPKLREEAEANRWKDIKPENFSLHIKKDYCMIRLDYVEEGIYEMRFKLGVEKNSFCSPAEDKYVDCSYEFIVHSQDKEVRDYYEEQNNEFCKTANAIMDLVMNWKALFFHSEDGIYISTEWHLAFQRYCLMLDILLPLKNDFSADHQLITSNMLQQKAKLEELLGYECEIANENPENKIFTHGKYSAESSVDWYISLGEDMISDIDVPF